jgi:hypothetical protein
MPRSILLDELHLRVFIPPDLPAHTVRALRRQLTARRFPTAIRQALRGVFQRNPALRVVRLQVTR